MGWISERKMRTGCALYEGGPKRKGPLKRIVVRLGGNYHESLFGHKATSYGGKRSICQKCRTNEPMDDMTEYGYSDASGVPVADYYRKHFTELELQERKNKSK